jgi:hypothetical protein
VIAYRVVTGAEEDWFNDAAAADAAVAGRLGIDSATLASLRRPIKTDPVVVRRDAARWRSRQVWTVRHANTSVRIFEMLQIDEALYEH